MLSDRFDLLREIDTLAREKIGILKLMEEDSTLYGYYLDWIVRKEQKLIRKYRRKYGRLPRVSLQY